MNFNKNTILFVMPTMTVVPQGLLRYGFPRSSIPITDRFQMVLEGIKSVKKALEGYDYRLIILEASEIPKDMENRISNEVDLYVRSYEDQDVIACTNSDCKSLGEVSTMTSFLRWFHKEYHDKPFRTMFKFGVRNELNENFNLANFLNEEKMVFIRSTPLPAVRMAKPDHPTNVFAGIYSIPYSLLTEYVTQMEKCYTWLSINEFEDIESCMGYTVEEHSTYFDPPAGITSIHSTALLQVEY
jgi:hypothetical protein